MRCKFVKGVTVMLLLAAMLVGLGPVGVAAGSYGSYKTPIQAVGGENHTVVLYSDGTVDAIGDNSQGQCNVQSWTGVESIAAGFNHTVGVRYDGTVLAAGCNNDGQCNVGTWRNIVQVAAGESHTLGLRADGTVVAVGSNRSNQCRVSRWTGITQIAAGKVNSLGLTSSGQVIVRGAFTNIEDYYLGGWRGVTAIASGTGYFAGLKGSDAIGTGRNTDPNGQGNYEEISVSGWYQISQIAVGRCNAFGLTRDGYVLCSGRNDFGQMDSVRGWSQIRSIGAGLNHVIGIRWDGTLVAAGDNAYDKCSVWRLDPNAQTGTASGAYLNELTYTAVSGKVWTRSNTYTPAGYDTPADAPGCWSDWSVPGHTSGPVRDNRGNLYTYGLHLDGSETSRYSISFQLNGRYRTFTGVCGYPENVISATWAPQYSKYFEVYGDGVLLYTTPTMNAHTAPARFSVPIGGVNVLTIVYPSTQGPNEAATLFDGYVS